ncbi:glycosyl hydrolase 115 family protein [Paenibacillus sp. YN15]|uniref:glycosyl hydrolase 115 family protein n=1 Tax=Paenibacillus sp. YN15 TaxID=1742774 RepID=UPI000DCB0CA3|nr:glycosyl hydrolase 115 family protein [Paenibacillus sp. YN15]RAU96397.1 hypothetical protein DQG13_20825 [Paenibacillus sp. YN15]
MQPSLELFAKHKTVHIYVSPSENEAVHLAADNLLRDIGSVCGCLAVLSPDMEQCSVVIGTVEQLEPVIRSKGLSADKLKQEDGSWRWEAFLQEAADGVLYIVGTDRRGVIYGIYDLCEDMGVSPWYYWADVPVKKKEAYYVPANLSKADWPSLQYRGIFINDEEELDDWAKQHTPDGTIGPYTYRRIFELLLRLKANYIWPAMHVNYFNGNPENGRLAEQMGIVVGTSHCDMLLRSNQNEWKPWIAAKGYTDAVYDYSIEGRNREILQEYWRESVETNQRYEVSFTMGMRGIHDSGFVTRAINEDASLTEEEKVDAKVRLLGQVIRDQRQILTDVLGERKSGEALKTFIPYKEVLTLYDHGLELPEDMTLVWANDNFGHMRRYPNEAERSRKGGNGLYFHCSYWAHPGSAMSYLFISSMPLAHMGNELKKSYASGIRKLWVLNIGGLKPVEQDMEYFLRYGWEAGKETGITKDAFQFTRHWIDTNFSGRHGAEAAELYERFAQATNVRKIEHMNSEVFSQTAYGDEAGRRLVRLEEIFRRGNAILRSLPPEEREAFFQLFLMKIHASYYINHEFYYADRSVLSYERGNMQAADRYTELSARMMDGKRRMIHYYNKIMAGGKWDGIMTPESFPPPVTAMYPARKPALRIEGSGLRVALWNDDEALLFSPYGRRQKWIELGNQGAGSIAFSLQTEADWIVLSETEGTVQTEKRILVTIQAPEIHAGKEAVIAVYDHSNGVEFLAPVRVGEAVALPEGFASYVESDGSVSIPAAAFDRSVADGSGAGWVTVPGIGRYEGAAVMAWHPELRSLDGELAEQPRLEYDFFLQSEGSHVLEIHRNLTLNSTGRVRLGIGVDGHPPVLVESETRDEWTGQWKESVFNNGEKLMVQLPPLSAGAHSLTLYMVDYYVTVSKLVLYTRARKDSSLGPAPGSRIGRPAAEAEYGLEAPELDWAELGQVNRELYRTAAREIPISNMLYVPDTFHKIKDTTFTSCPQVPQPELGAARYADLWKSTGPKDMIKEFGAGKFIESGGVVAIEAEYALENSGDAYLTPGTAGNAGVAGVAGSAGSVGSAGDTGTAGAAALFWSHLQAETNGRTGLAMHVAPPGILWEEPEAAPGMHYRMVIRTPGPYKVWLLLRHYNNQSDSCYLALDGAARPLDEQPRKGNLHTYNTAYIYYWCFMSELELTAGEHVFSILARKSQLRVDRIYLTRGDELPPVDAHWKDSVRE